MGSRLHLARQSRHGGVLPSATAPLYNQCRRHRHGSDPNMGNQFDRMSECRSRSLHWHTESLWTIPCPNTNLPAWHSGSATGLDWLCLPIAPRLRSPLGLLSCQLGRHFHCSLHCISLDSAENITYIIYFCKKGCNNFGQFANNRYICSAITQMFTLCDAKSIPPIE